MSNFQKQKPWRSRKYLDWVKSLPCCHCGRPADDPHHIIGEVRGMGQKVDDWKTIPLCRECHNSIHMNANRDTFAEQWRDVANTLWKAAQAGIIK